MKIAKFKKASDAETFGLSVSDEGIVVAESVTDNKQIMVIRFDAIEINGISPNIFTFEEIEDVA